MLGAAQGALRAPGRGSGHQPNARFAIGLTRPRIQDLPRRGKPLPRRATIFPRGANICPLPVWGKFSIRGLVKIQWQSERARIGGLGDGHVARAQAALAPPCDAKALVRPLSGVWAWRASPDHNVWRSCLAESRFVRFVRVVAHRGRQDRPDWRAGEQGGRFSGHCDVKKAVV